MWTVEGKKRETVLKTSLPSQPTSLKGGRKKKDRKMRRGKKRGGRLMLAWERRVGYSEFFCLKQLKKGGRRKKETFLLWM